MQCLYDRSAGSIRRGNGRKLALQVVLGAIREKEFGSNSRDGR